jgi:AraC-like DNA-binding protein
LLIAFHLARVFRQRTGVPDNKYLARMRLGGSIEQFAEGANDSTALALDLGFSGHSRFTNALRREFGLTLITVHRRHVPRALGEISKNLTV